MKPTIPRNIAAAIETVRKAGADNANILRNSLGLGYAGSYCRKRRDLHEFARAKPDVLAAALINGYETELTEKQQRVREVLVEWYGAYKSHLEPLIEDIDRIYTEVPDEA